MSLQMPELPRTDQGKRMCQVIKVKPEALDEYKRVHEEVWPDVLAALRKAKVVDYSIHYFEPASLLIAHMRYVGPHSEFGKKMKEISENEATRKWWKLTDGMQESFIPGSTGSEDARGWWSPAKEVFRMEG